MDILNYKEVRNQMDHLVMHQTGIAITMACNLKCKLCSNYAPYYAQPKYHSLDYIKEMMRRYFVVVTHIKKLMFTGGEPLLHPELGAVIDDLCQYRDRIDIFGVITNGTIAPGQSVLDAARHFGPKFHFLIDNYGQELSTKAVETAALLEAHGIRYILRNYTADGPHCGGWVDFGDLSQKKCMNLEETEALYAKCAYPQKLHFAFDLVDGAMYPCGPSRRCKELGIAENYSEYINLFDDALTAEEQRKKIVKIYEKKSLAACAYCNGMHETSPRFQPGIQLTCEELAQIKAGARFPADIDTKSI